MNCAPALRRRAYPLTTIVEAAIHTDPRDMDSFQAYGFHSIERLKAFLYYTIYKWVHKRCSDIRNAFWMRGGWEGWLQVELGLWLMEAGFAVEREMHVFKNARQAADMIVRHENFEGATIIIELKCEGWFQDFDAPGEPDESRQRDDTPLSFQTRIMEDVEKFGDAGSNIHDNYRGIYYCCIGISMMETSRDCLFELQNKGGYFQGYSLEMLEELALEQGSIHAEQAELMDDVQDSDLIIWWSALHRKA